MKQTCMEKSEFWVFQWPRSVEKLYQLAPLSEKFLNCFLCKNDMLVVQESGLVVEHEELTAICIRPVVRHRDPLLVVMLQIEILIVESVAVNWDRACSVLVNYIASLKHEALVDSVDSSSVVAINSLVALALESVSAKRFEVFHGFGNLVSE